MADEEFINIRITRKDWVDFCVIMRSLTWGKHPDMDLWHAMRERISERIGPVPSPKDEDKRRVIVDP